MVAGQTPHTRPGAGKCAGHVLETREGDGEGIYSHLTSLTEEKDLWSV